MSNLPELPPMLEDNGFRARSAIADKYNRPVASSSADERAESLWGQPVAFADADHPTPTPAEGDAGYDADYDADNRQERPHDGRLRALWSAAATRLRRSPIVLVGIAGAVVLCLVVGSVAALGATFLQGNSSASHGIGGAGSATSLSSPSAGHATPGATTTTGATTAPIAAATAAPANTQPPTPLTIAVTCASGVIGGTGKVCAHTLPHAALSLTVRYCDGSYAKGKAFHGVSYADSSGNYTWTWNVTTTCAGAATASVTATSAGKTVTTTSTFTITR